MCTNIQVPTIIQLQFFYVVLQPNEMPLSMVWLFLVPFIHFAFFSVVAHHPYIDCILHTFPFTAIGRDKSDQTKNVRREKNQMLISLLLIFNYIILIVESLTFHLDATKCKSTHHRNDCSECLLSSIVCFFLWINRLHQFRLKSHFLWRITSNSFDVWLTAFKMEQARGKENKIIELLTQ